jgi:hypothetical protein
MTTTVGLDDGTHDILQVLGYDNPGVGYRPPPSRRNMRYGGIRENFDIPAPPLDHTDKDQVGNI